MLFLADNDSFKELIRLYKETVRKYGMAFFAFTTDVDEFLHLSATYTHAYSLCGDFGYSEVKTLSYSISAEKLLEMVLSNEKEDFMSQDSFLIEDGELEIYDIATRIIIEEPDDEGDIQIAIKATVDNIAYDSGNVFFDIQAIDEDDFELETYRLSGNIPVGETKVLTTKEYMNEILYQQVKEWRVQ